MLNFNFRNWFFENEETDIVYRKGNKLRSRIAPKSGLQTGNEELPYGMSVVPKQSVLNYSGKIYIKPNNRSDKSLRRYDVYDYDENFKSEILFGFIYYKPNTFFIELNDYNFIDRWKENEEHTKFLKFNKENIANVISNFLKKKIPEFFGSKIRKLNGISLELHANPNSFWRKTGIFNSLTNKLIWMMKDLTEFHPVGEKECEEESCLQIFAKAIDSNKQVDWRPNETVPEDYY